MERAGELGQRRHRELDKEIVQWIETYKKATPEQFEAYLRRLYNRPDLKKRFPGGLSR